MTHELTDEEIMERVDFLANGHRLDYAELIEFARSIETAVLAHLAQRGTSEQAPHEAYADAWRAGFLAAQAVAAASPHVVQPEGMTPSVRQSSNQRDEKE